MRCTATNIYLLVLLQALKSCGPVFFPSQTNLPIIEILGVNVIPNEDRFAVTVAVDSGPCAGGAQVDGEMCPTTRKQELRITLCSASPSCFNTCVDLGIIVV